MTATIAPVCLSLRRETSAPPYQSITRFLAGSEWTSLALRGSSTMIRSAPRPVSVPPTEVAYRLPPLSRDELEAGFLRPPQGGKERRIPLGADHHPKLSVEFGGEVARIACHDHAACRIVAEQPSDIRNRDADRFERARRLVDHQGAGPRPRGPASTDGRSHPRASCEDRFRRARWSQRPCG